MKIFKQRGLESLLIATESNVSLQTSKTIFKIVEEADGSIRIYKAGNMNDVIELTPCASNVIIIK